MASTQSDQRTAEEHMALNFPRTRAKALLPQLHFHDVWRGKEREAEIRSLLTPAAKYHCTWHSYTTYTKVQEGVWNADTGENNTYLNHISDSLRSLEQSIFFFLISN